MTENRQKISDSDRSGPDAVGVSMDHRERLRAEMAKTFSGVGDLATFARAQRTADGVRVAPVLTVTEVTASLASVEISAVQTFIGQDLPPWRMQALPDEHGGVATSVPAPRNEEVSAKAEAVVPRMRGLGERFGADVRLAVWSVLAVAAVSVGAVGYLRACDRETAHDARIASPVVNVSAREGAIVRAIYVSDGQRVEAGDLIAELEATDDERAMNASKANMAGAASELVRPRREAAEAQREEEAARRLSATKIYAQVAGVIGARNIDVGDYVAAGHRIFSLFQRDDAWVTAYFRETQLRRLRPGQHARVYVPALDEALHGVVDSVVGTVGAATSPSSTKGPDQGGSIGDRVVPVRIRFAPRQPALQRLLPGMSVEAIVTVP